MKRRPLVVAVPFSLLLLTACKHERPTNNALSNAQAQSVIETITVHPQEVANQLSLAARVVPNPTSIVHIYPMISGRVLSLKVLPGQELQQGQQIGTLQSSEAAQARADFQKAKIEATRADLQLQRAKELLQHEVMAQRDYDDLKALDDSDHSELERARQALHLLGFTENDASDIVPIVSPISGVVLDVNTGPGELQRSLDNANAIATIADIRMIWVVGDLYPRDLGSVKVGQPVEISVAGYPDQLFHGAIDNISDAVDPTSLTLKVRVVLQNPQHRLKPQMYATIAVTNQRGTAIVVPSTAVIQNGKETIVFVETSPGKYARRNVTLGATHDKTDEIMQGLENGDKVVSSGAELLREAQD
jgi:cobalt-zinc-cadmium efflux system membrane fusion protein